MPKVTAVLPSLNVEKYIEACLASVQKQTLKDIEILCVDAGSIDGTLERLRQYEKNDNRIKVLVSDKKSYGYQVNLGICQAQGEYIAIVDTDDMIKPDMYERLYRTAKDNDADFVKADYEEVSEQNGNIAVLRTVRIAKTDENYNKLLTAIEQRTCMLPNITATWSGIYKKTFLERNKIFHNETPGASYQDTGFWFLTHMFAERAYFVNNAYYQYRIDNANSSVNSTDKVFCICSEFDYILDRIKENHNEADFVDKFCFIFYKKYKRNMERIKRQYHISFLERFAEDLKKLDRMGMLHIEAWNLDNRKEIEDIMANPVRYYENVLDKRKKFLEYIQKFENIIIYGMGKVGSLLYDSIADKDRIISFAVTTMQDKLRQQRAYYKGVPVYELKTMDEYWQSAAVIVAVKTPEYQSEMIEEARKYGFRNIVKLPYGVFDFE